MLETVTAISGVSNANPGVITDTAHGYSNGDLVYLSGIGGTTQLNGRFATIANATTNTYKRELNVRQIKALAERFHVNPAVFLQ